MNRKFLKTAIVAGSALAALALGTSTASAATTFTVKAGSAKAGTAVALKGATTGASPQIVFTDTTTGTVLNCTSATAPGTVKVGTGLSGSGIATINGAGTVWNGCTGPLGLNFKVTGSGTWSLVATAGTSAGASGALKNVSATVNGGSSCTFSVTGAVAGKYTNSNTTLSFPGTTSNLTIANVQGGCFGAVNSGDKASFKASYKVTATTSAYNPVTITAP